MSGLLQGNALPPFAALRAFEAVGRAGGIRKAAAALNVDHTVVSRHLMTLEEWLGASLFHRSAGRLSLTTVGAAYHARVTSALLELALATSDVLQADDQQEIRVWSVPGFTAQWLQHQVVEFKQAWPEYVIELRPTDMAADLVMNEADVDIRFYGNNWAPTPGGKGLRFVELARPPLVAVASPTLAERLGPFPDASRFTTAPLLHEEHHEQWKKWLAVNGVSETVKLPGQLLWHAHLTIAAAKKDQGIALANRYLLGDDLNNGSLVEIRPPGCRQAVIGAYAFVAREDRWSLPIIKRLRSFLQGKAQ